MEEFTEFKLYNSNSGNQSTNCNPGNNSDKHLRPFKIFRDERSWDATGQLFPTSENWVLLQTNISYNANGLLKESSRPGWAGANSIYNYDNKKRLTSSQVAAQTATYEYYGHSMLLERKN